MSILNQTSQSQLSVKGKKGGIDINSKNITNYDNTLVTTRGQGNVISQIELPNQSNLSLEPGETNDQSYLNTNID
jgi:hypothetical protein